MRTPEDQKIISHGEMWETFKHTLYYEELVKFLDEAVSEAKESVLVHTLEQDYERAKAEGHKISGLRAVIDFINGSIEAASDVVEEEKQAKVYDKQIPKHVR